MKASDFLGMDSLVEMFTGFDSLCKAMEEYAFEAYKAGEENGRQNLNMFGPLDENGSKIDFEKWLNQPRKNG